MTLRLTLCFVWFGLCSPARTFAEELQSDAKVTTRFNVIYGQPEEPMHRCDIYRPTDASPGQKLPGVILIHGGAWTAGDKQFDSQHGKRLAGLGFVVMAINYRLAPKHRYPAQFDDCVLALQWFVEHADELSMDATALGAWGYSAGGHLSAMLATSPAMNQPHLKACVVGAGPCDLTSIPPNSRLLSGVFGGTRAQLPQIYADASPVNHIKAGLPPMFLFHGTKDWLVPLNSSELMQSKLEEHGIPFEFYTVPGKGHLASFIDQEAMDRSFAFLQKHLAAPKSKAD